MTSEHWQSIGNKKCWHCWYRGADLSAIMMSARKQRSIYTRRSSPPQSIARPATFRFILRAVPYAHDSMAAPCMLKRVGGIKQSSACRPWLLCQSSFEVMELRQKAQSGVSTWSPMKCFMQCSCNVGEHASLDRCF